MDHLQIYYLMQSVVIAVKGIKRRRIKIHNKPIQPLVYLPQ